MPRWDSPLVTPTADARAPGAAIPITPVQSGSGITGTSSGMGETRPNALIFKHAWEFWDARLSGMNATAGSLLHRHGKNAR